MWNTGKRKRKWGKHVGNCCLHTGISWTFSNQFSCKDRTTGRKNPRVLGNLNCFPAHFSLWRDQNSQHEAKWQSKAVDVHLATWIYSAIYLIYSDIHEFILQQIFNELIDGKLSLFQRIKTKAFIVFDWEDASVEEEEAKVIATRFIIHYLWLWREKGSIFKLFFSCFDYFLFIPPKSQTTWTN